MTPRPCPRGPPHARVSPRRAASGASPQVVERGDRPVGRGVAEPAGGADRRRAGVVGGGDRQLGRGQDRLAGLGGDLGGGLREAGVLALVVGDDALEAVVGVEAALRASCRAWFDWMPRPRYTITASTSGWRATSSSTSGIVSRVSPPARSIGLLRLHRGGSCSSIVGAQVVGQRRELERRSPAIASAVTTPQPPAVVTTATPVARRAAAGSRTWRRPRTPPRSVRGPGHAGLAAHRRRRPGRRWRATRCGWPRRAAPPAVAPPFTSTTGLRSATPAQARRRTRARRRCPRRRRGRPRSRGRRRRSRGSRRTPTAAALPADTARLTPTPVCAGVVQERRHEVARLAGDRRCGPAGGYGRTICAHSGAGVDTTPWPFGPGEQDAELVGERDQLGLGGAGPPRPPRRSRPT